MKITSQEALERAFAPAIAFAQTPEIKTAIASLMCELTGQKVTRQMVGRWLHPDPEKRNEPAFGTGLMLLLVAAAIQAAEQDKKLSNAYKITLDLNPITTTKK